MSKISLTDTLVYVDDQGKQKRAEPILTPDSQHGGDRLKGADAEVRVASPGPEGAEEVVYYRRFVTLQEDGTVRKFVPAEPEYDEDDEDDEDGDDLF